MGKAKKKQKIANVQQAKVPLDEQISQGRVAKPKNKFKLKFRAEEENVRKLF